jgi:hypothetical protein
VLSDADLKASDEFDREQLRAALVAGKIPPVDETVDALDHALRGIRVRYRLYRIVRQRTPAGRLVKRLATLRKAASEVVKILDSDLAEDGEIGSMLGAFWLDPADIVGRLHRLLEVTEQLERIVDQATYRAHYPNKPPKAAMARHPETPETRLFLEIHGLYRKLRGGPRSRIAGPLYRFTKHCVWLLDRDIAVPPLDAFKRRLRAAVERRSVKMGTNQSRTEG